MQLHSNFAIVTILQLLIAIKEFYCVEGRKGFGPGEQEWGYVTVRPGAHMFWWLHYTTSVNITDVHDKPLLIWLQGGPGSSATGYGNFEMFGSFDLDLNHRNTTWVKDYNVLFIDSPVGTGFSFVESSEYYARNNTEIAVDLLELMKEFFKKLPKFDSVPIYIIGESYGGKMAPEFALVWHEAQKSGNIKSNLQGVAAGNPWISPIDSVLSYAPYLLQTGMVDTEGFEKITEATSKVKLAVANEEWVTALFEKNRTRAVIHEAVGNMDSCNILSQVMKRSPDNCKIHKKILTVLMNDAVKNALGLNANATWSHRNSDVHSNLIGDNMKPVTDIVEQLLNDTDLQVFVYSGQLDSKMPTSGTLAWIERLKWKGASKWREADRHILVVDDIIEGYVKEYDNFKMIWINRAGHMVPRDNPAATAAMLKLLTAKG